LKTRFNTTLISVLVVSACLIELIPGSLRFASTWREIYFETPGFKEQNFLMQLGFCALGLEMIGLIVLWTGYRKKERWAWFVMLIILLFLVFPLNVLKLLLDMQTPSFGWSAWFRGIREGYPPSVGLAVGVLNFLVMLVALLLPIKAFFLRPVSLKAVLPQREDEIIPQLAPSKVAARIPQTTVPPKTNALKLFRNATGSRARVGRTLLSDASDFGVRVISNPRAGPEGPGWMNRIGGCSATASD
jgi:hypothetical protein